MVSSIDDTIHDENHKKVIAMSIYLDTFVFMDLLSGNKEIAEKAAQYIKEDAVVSSVLFACYQCIKPSAKKTVDRLRINMLYFIPREWPKFRIPKEA